MGTGGACPTSLGRLRLTNAPRVVRDAQAGPARFTDADVHTIDALSKRERCRAADRTDRDDVAGVRKIGFQEITTAVTISGEPRQSQSAGFVRGINYRRMRKRKAVGESMTLKEVEALRERLGEARTIASRER
jgi:hypothetical protein